MTALAPRDATSRARLRELRSRSRDLVLPAAVAAEGLLTGHPGHDFSLQRLLEIVVVDAVDRRLGFAAGELRSQALDAGAAPPPSGIDAIVAAVADARAATDDVEILTSDPDDLGVLVLFTRNARRIAITRV